MKKYEDREIKPGETDDSTKEKEVAVAPIGNEHGPNQDKTDHWTIQLGMCAEILYCVQPKYWDALTHSPR